MPMARCLAVTEQPATSSALSATAQPARAGSLRDISADSIIISLLQSQWWREAGVPHLLWMLDEGQSRSVDRRNTASTHACSQHASDPPPFARRGRARAANGVATASGTCTWLAPLPPHLQSGALRHRLRLDRSSSTRPRGGQRRAEPATGQLGLRSERAWSIRPTKKTEMEATWLRGGPSARKPRR